MKKIDSKDKKRMIFLLEYFEFDKWLKSIGYISSNSNTTSTYHYGAYDEYIDSLYGVERYVNATLRTELIFVRDKSEHKFMVVSSGAMSDVLTITEMKNVVTQETLELKTDLLNKLEKICI